MAVNKFYKSRLKELFVYWCSFMAYSFIFHLLGYEPDTFGNGWQMFVYYIVLNIVAIPTSGFVLALWMKRKNKKQSKQNN